MNAIIGKKVGMTQVFDENGFQVPVTVLKAGPCVVVQNKTREHDGYAAVQLGFEEQKERRVSKPVRGHYMKANVACQRLLREIRLDNGEEAPQNGSTVNVSIFEGVPFVDVIGPTKGRGFQGVMKRWGMSGGRATHGSTTHRGPGSIGQCEFPARIFKNKHMPGHMGNRRITTQNLKVVQVRADDNVLLVRGAVPGPVGGYIIVRKAIKKS